MEPKQPATKKYQLPSLVIGPADVNRLLLEMESLEDFMRQAAMKSPNVKLPKTTRTLDDLADLNDVDLSLEAGRLELLSFLQSLQQHAPVIHISFAAEPSAAFTVKIVSWMRENISTYVLVQVGLQPSIAAGCVVRTTNKVFDLSLGRFLRAKRHLLTDALHKAGINQTTVSAPVPVAAAVAIAAPVPGSVPRMQVVRTPVAVAARHRTAA